MPISVDAIDEVLSGLGNRNLNSRPASVYVDEYIPLLRLFELIDFDKQRSNSTPAELVRAGAYAVYGWMPTMLKRPPSSEQAAELLTFLAECKSGKEVPLAKLSDVLLTVNASVVGTSKFLHFARPDVFPIWDSVLARGFGLKHPYQYSTSAAYLSYFQASSAWRAAGKLLPGNFVAWFSQAPGHQKVGQVRRLEVALYLEGQLRIEEKRRTNAE